MPGRPWTLRVGELPQYFHCCIFSAQNITRLILPMTSHHCQIFLPFQIKAQMASCLYTWSDLWLCAVSQMAASQSPVSRDSGDSFHLCASEEKVQTPRWWEVRENSLQPSLLPHLNSSEIWRHRELSAPGRNCSREIGTPAQEVAEKQIEDSCTVSVIVFPGTERAVRTNEASRCTVWSVDVGVWLS